MSYKPFIAAAVTVVATGLTVLGVDIGDQEAIVDAINGGITAVVALAAAVAGGWLAWRERGNKEDES